MMDEDFMVNGQWETLDEWFDEYSDTYRPVLVSSCLWDKILSLFGQLFQCVDRYQDCFVVAY